MRTAIVAIMVLGLSSGLVGSASAQDIDTLLLDIVTTPSSLTPTGGPVLHTVGLDVLPDTNVTIASLQSDRYGDLADPSNPLLTSTTCITPATHLVGESHAPWMWVCQYTAPISGDPGEVVDTVTLTLETEAGTEHVVSGRSSVTISSGVGAIQGTLTDAVTGDPIPEAFVDLTGELGGGSASTDASGFFNIQGITPGNYQLVSGNTQVWPGTDYARSFLDVTVNPGETTVVEWSLTVGGVIEGVVTDATSGGPLAHTLISVIEVTADGERRDFGHGATTAADGTYRFGGLYAGDFIVCFYQDGYHEECWNDHPVAGDFLSLTGDLIAVELGGTYPDIDAALAGVATSAPVASDDDAVLPRTGIDGRLLAIVTLAVLVSGSGLVWFSRDVRVRRSSG